jgi:lipoprotein NlpI
MPAPSCFGLLVSLLAVLSLSPQPGRAQTTAEALLDAAQQAATQRDFPRAVSLATEALARDPALATSYYLRARARFCLGQFPESADDFDRFTQLRPDQRSRLWERGIACYYAGRFRHGADQFTAYQDFDDSDVENAVWHVLCLSRIEGLPAAQRQMMTVKQDGRVPMMAIYDLFRGRATPQQVLQIVERAGLTGESQRAAYFYAHFYIGLFYEASADDPAARRHISLAAEQFRIDHYMGDVARVHAARVSRN